MMKHVMLTLAAMAWMGCHAQGAAALDTVKVINNPTQVVITEQGGEVRLQVSGEGDKKDYRYEYRMRHNADDRVTTTQREGGDLEFNYPFKKCDSTGVRPHMQVFLSDLYVGWGGSRVEPAYRGQIGGSHSEAGILNLIGIGYVFNRNRSRLSLGVGFNLARYGAKKPYFWSRDDEGAAGVATLDWDFSRHHSTLRCWSLQFPLMYNLSLGKRVDIAAGVVANCKNFSTTIDNRYRIGKDDHHISTRGLHQRKYSFDYVGMISWHGLGAYVRYSPQSLFKDGWGPRIDNRWTVGMILRGL